MVVFWLVVIVALQPQISLGWRRRRAAALLQSIRHRVPRSMEGPWKLKWAATVWRDMPRSRLGDKEFFPWS